jgi:hypothetical protein
MPDNCREWCEHFKGMHRFYDYRLYGNELLERYAHDPYVKFMVDKGEKWAFIADRLRVLLLRDEGGIYVDCDAMPVRSFDSIGRILDNPKVDFVTGLRSPYRKHVALHRGISLVDNTVMLSAKNGRMINRLAGLWQPGKEKQCGYDMGIEVLTNADDATVLLNWRYFYASESSAETIILHDTVNLGSWIPKPVNSFQQEVLNAATA